MERARECVFVCVFARARARYVRVVGVRESEQVRK